jgi:hypothetical protein
MQLKPGDTFTADNVQLRIVEGPDGTQNLELDDTSDADFYILDEDVSPDKRYVNWDSSTRSYEVDDPEEDEDDDGAE